MNIIKILIIIGVILIILIEYSSCVVAGNSDDIAEQAYQNYIKNMKGNDENGK